MNKEILQIACELTMVSDPWQGTDKKEKAWKHWLNTMAKDAGYSDWVAAYHATPANPPMPDYDTLIDLGVKHTLDAEGEKLCKVPEDDEMCMNSVDNCTIITGGRDFLDDLYGRRRWIVEDDEYAPAKAAFRDGELQMAGSEDEWHEWNDDREPTWLLPPDRYRRKPKGGWVECAVEEWGHSGYFFESPEGDTLMLPNAPGVRGFGQYGYGDEWCNELKRDERGVIVKPSHVRFWREG